MVEYAQFATLMAESYPTYSWEALKIKSGPDLEDSTTKPYELTTFRVWSPTDRDENLAPVYWQGGLRFDAS